MSDELSAKARDVLDDVRAGLNWAGMHDDDAVAELVQAGLVRRDYGNPAGFLGLSKLIPTKDPTL